MQPHPIHRWHKIHNTVQFSTSFHLERAWCLLSFLWHNGNQLFWWNWKLCVRGHHTGCLCTTVYLYAGSVTTQCYREVLGTGAFLGSCWRGVHFRSDKLQSSSCLWFSGWNEYSSNRAISEDIRPKSYGTYLGCRTPTPIQNPTGLKSLLLIEQDLLPKAMINNFIYSMKVYSEVCKAEWAGHILY